MLTAADRWRRCAIFAALFIGAVVSAALMPRVVPSTGIDGLFVDFTINVWEPGRAILDGSSPIRTYDSDGAHEGSVYPPIAPLLTLPFAVLPHPTSAVLWLFVLVASVLGALRMCGVDDPRCVVVALLSPPVIAGLAYGNVALVVMLGLAAAWYWRDRPLRLGLTVGLLIASRLFVWPLLLWLLFTRRFRAAATTALVAALFTVLGWAAIGFRDVEAFVDTTRRNAAEYVGDGSSVMALAAGLGAPSVVFTLAGLGAALVSIGIAWRRRLDDLECLAWIVAAALFGSPIVWAHYFALALVPLAVASPRLSRAWLLPYITAPQLIAAAPAGLRIAQACSGIVFTIVTALVAGRRSALEKGVTP